MIFLIAPSFVFAGTSYSINGENYTVGDSLNITITSHDECVNDTQLKEVAVSSWGGSPSGFAIDFSQAAISATLNGSPLNGTRRYLIHPSKMDNVITLQLASPQLFKKAGDIIQVTITGAKRVFPQSGAYQLHLLEQPTDTISYSGCGTQPSIGTHYTDQAAEQRKAEGLPTEESPDSVTINGSQKSQRKPTKLVSPEPSLSTKPSLTPSPSLATQKAKNIQPTITQISKNQVLLHFH